MSMKATNQDNLRDEPFAMATNNEETKGDTTPSEVWEPNKNSAKKNESAAATTDKSKQTQDQIMGLESNNNQN